MSKPEIMMPYELELVPYTEVDPKVAVDTLMEWANDRATAHDLAVEGLHNFATAYKNAPKAHERFNGITEAMREGRTFGYLAMHGDQPVGMASIMPNLTVVKATWPVPEIATVVARHKSWATEPAVRAKKTCNTSMFVPHNMEEDFAYASLATADTLDAISRELFPAHTAWTLAPKDSVKSAAFNAIGYKSGPTSRYYEHEKRSFWLPPRRMQLLTKTLPETT